MRAVPGIVELRNGGTFPEVFPLENRGRELVKQKELYSEAFMIAWEHIEEMGGFARDEREKGDEPMKAKIYELMEAGETDTMALATNASHGSATKHKLTDPLTGC